MAHEGGNGGASIFQAVWHIVEHIADVEHATLSKMRRCLYGVGGYARKVMKTGMKFRKGTSGVGNYPNSHHGELRNLVNFGVDDRSLSVIVGPQLYPGSRDTSYHSKTNPQLINEGGTAVRMLKPKNAPRIQGVNNKIPVTQRYRARPFVALTLPFAIRIMRHNIETEPLNHH